MTDPTPTFSHESYANYQWLIHYLLTFNDEMSQYILNHFYIDEPVREFLQASLTTDEQGDISPSSMDLEHIIELLNSFFDDDTYHLYVTNPHENITYWNEVPEEFSLEDILEPNTIKFETIQESVLPLLPTQLPDAIRDYVIHSAKSMDNAPPDYTATACITSFAGLLGNNAQIQPKVHATSWRIPPNIWAAKIGPPSSKKTPSINNGLRPLNYAIKTVLEPRNKELLKQYRTDKKMFDAKRKSLQKELDEHFKEGNESLAERKANEIANLDKPQLKSRDFLIHDATQEALAKKMSENDNGILNVRDELSGWLESMNKQNQSHARAFYLEAYNGTNNYTVERIASESFTIDRTLMSVTGGIQPSKLTPLLEDRQNGTCDDGLMERLIQFSVFPDHLGGEYIDEPFDEMHEERINRLFVNAAKLNKADDPLIVTFSSEAQKLWDQWAKNHAKQVNTMTESMQSIYGKQATVCAKLALIFHMMGEFDGDDIQADAIDAQIRPDSIRLAFDWITYIDSHIKRIMNYAREDKEFYLAKELLERMPKLDHGFTIKQLSDKGWAIIKKKEARERALAKLVEHNYLTVQDEGSGTKPKPVYYKHSSLL